MVAENTARTYDVYQVFLLVEGIWLHRKSSNPIFFLSKNTYFTSYVRTMF